MRARLRRSELAAVELLARQRDLSIYDFAHLDVRRLEYPFDVLFDSLERYSATAGVDLSATLCEGAPLPDGLTVALGGRYLVLYNDRVDNRARLQFTIAHEIGHICLGHDEGDARAEREANAFAASLLMPAAAIRYLERLAGHAADAEMLRANFNVSQAAAQARLSELETERAAARPLAGAETLLLMKLFGRVGRAEER